MECDKNTTAGQRAGCLIDVSIQHSVGTRLLSFVCCKKLFVFEFLSLSQTKDALFTILRDLRPGDRFNFISFSNKIKVWQPDRLVPVTPLNVRDAKKFIYMLPTTGGETLLSLYFDR